MSSSVQLPCRLAAAHRVAVWCQEQAAVAGGRHGRGSMARRACGGTAPGVVGLSSALQGPAPEQVAWPSRWVQN